MTQDQMQQRWLPRVTTVTMPVIERIVCVRDGMARCELEDGQIVNRPVRMLMAYYRPETELVAA